MPIFRSQRSRVLALGAVAALVVCAADQQKQVLFNMNGQQVSGGFSALDPATGLVLGGSFSPATAPDGKQAFLAQWSVCTPPPPPSPEPPPPPFCPIVAAGLLPVSAVSVSGGRDVIEFRFDTAAMVVAYAVSGRSIWQGKLARYSGMFSYSQQSSGSQESRNVFPGFPDTVMTLVQKTTGIRQQWSANFAGSVGPFAVVPPTVGSNGGAFVGSGGTAQLLYTAR